MRLDDTTCPNTACSFSTGCKGRVKVRSKPVRRLFFKQSVLTWDMLMSCSELDGNPLVALDPTLFDRITALSALYVNSIIVPNLDLKGTGHKPSGYWCDKPSPAPMLSWLMYLSRPSAKALRTHHIVHSSFLISTFVLYSAIWCGGSGTWRLVACHRSPQPSQTS